MSKNAAQKIDFFSLRVFCAVYEKRSFTKAADFLRINQSVVSYTVERLRTVFDDALFVRQAGETVATERCHAISGDVHAILERFEALVEPTEFDPAALERTFRVSCNFYERNLILPAVFKELRQQAPNARMVVVSAGTQGMHHLNQGQADLWIGPMLPEGEGFYCRALFKDSYVCVMDRENPLAARPVTVEQFTAANHVEVSYGEDWTSEYLSLLEPMLGDLPQSRLTVPSPGDVPNIVRGTDLIATIPSLYAEMLGDRVHIARFPEEAFLRIGLVWNKRTHGSVVHKWFRDLVVEATGPLAIKAAVQS